MAIPGASKTFPTREAAATELAKLGLFASPPARNAARARRRRTIPAIWRPPALLFCLAAALAGVRVLPEIEPFFHRLGFAIIGSQSLIAHWPGNCGLVVAGSTTAGAGHGLRRLGVGCEDADCVPRPRQMGHTEGMGLLGCVGADR